MPPADRLPDPLAIATLGGALLSDEGRGLVTAFVRSRRAPEGGFLDRAGHPDLYYTVFGLECLRALDAGLPPPRDIRPFLDRAVAAGGSFVERASRIRCLRLLVLSGGEQPGDALRWREDIERLERHRSADGGYSHERERAAQGTAYAAYLAEQAYRDAACAWPASACVHDALDTLRTPDGGYANHSGVPEGSAPATAAAMVVRVRCGRPEVACAAGAFLAACRHPQGGCRSSVHAPQADLLSTATAFYAGHLCGGDLPARVPFRETAAWIEGLWHSDGGFRSHADDPVSDVEYTFYALLALGALAASRPRPAQAAEPKPDDEAQP